jgi:type II secretory pathway predicted ATPase ExeA
LKEKNISSITITPQVTQDAGIASALYSDLARRQAKVFDAQAMAMVLERTMVMEVAAGREVAVVMVRETDREMAPG